MLATSYEINKKRNHIVVPGALETRMTHKKVSLENSSLPSHLPLELQNFTQMEEMFIILS